MLYLLCKICFWASFCFVAYTYFGYPVYLWLRNCLFPKKVFKQYPLNMPAVSVVIAAKNEEENIVARLENLLEQEYPKNRMQIIVVSDGSTDNTLKLLLNFNSLVLEGSVLPDIVVIELPESKGKPNALNLGVKQATGDILMFTDCRQKFATNAFGELVANFSDPTVGCVSGELIFYQESNPTLEVEMGAYWKYEKTVRRLESATGSVMGATGAIYAIRRRLYRPVPEAVILDDVLIPMQVVEQGFRVVFDSAAVAYDTISKKLEQEWTRKVRTLAGNWQLIGNYGLLARGMTAGYFFRFFWHKSARLFVPLFLVGALVGSYLADSNLYLGFFFLQVLLYGVLSLSLLIRPFREWAPIKLLNFFMLLNWAIVVSFLTWIRGDIGNIWKK